MENSLLIKHDYKIIMPLTSYISEAPEARLTKARPRPSHLYIPHWLDQANFIHCNYNRDAHYPLLERVLGRRRGLEEGDLKV